MVTHMEDLCVYADRPFAFVSRYLKRRALPHLVILCAVLGAVAFSVSTDYALKGVVDALSKGPDAGLIWGALAVLIAFIAADNMLWRVASLVGSFTFVGVTGDIRRDLFRHMTGHSPSFFADRQPGTLASRITATSNAIFTVENMFVFNVMPPCVAAFLSIVYIGTVNLTMAGVLAGIFAAVVILMFKMAAAGKPLHHDFAAKAASVDGEMVDLVGNMPLVRAFSAFKREYKRFDGTIGVEMRSRRSSLLYLEKGFGSFTRSSQSSPCSACSTGPSPCGKRARPRTDRWSSSAPSASVSSPPRATSPSPWWMRPSIRPGCRRPCIPCFSRTT